MCLNGSNCREKEVHVFKTEKLNRKNGVQCVKVVENAVKKGYTVLKPGNQTVKMGYNVFKWFNMP